MRQSGMTLVELLVVMAVASIIGIAMLNLFVTSNRTFMDQNKVLDAQRDGRLVMEFMARAMREAGLNPLRARDPGTGELIAGVEAATPTSIRFSRDSDMDGAIDTTGFERLSFVYDAGREMLLRGVNEGAGPPDEVWTDMVKNVSGFSLVYFDADGAQLLAATPGDPLSAVQRAQVRSITLTVTFRDTRFVDSQNFTRSYTTGVVLRNL